MPDEIEVVQAQLARTAVGDSDECGELIEVGERIVVGGPESLIFELHRRWSCACCGPCFDMCASLGHSRDHSLHVPWMRERELNTRHRHT